MLLNLDCAASKGPTTQQSQRPQRHPPALLIVFWQTEKSSWIALPPLPLPIVLPDRSIRQTHALKSRRPSLSATRKVSTSAARTATMIYAAISVLGTSCKAGRQGEPQNQQRTSQGGNPGTPNLHLVLQQRQTTALWNLQGPKPLSTCCATARA